MANNKNDDSSNWENLNDKQIIKTIITDSNDAVFIIAPKNFNETYVPIFCPLCEFPMKTKEDVSEYKRVQLCEKCSYKWSDKKNLIYKKHFKDSDDWEEYLEHREQVSKIILNLK